MTPPPRWIRRRRHLRGHLEHFVYICLDSYFPLLRSDYGSG